jgi:26S proteasome regulatory subunit N2
MMFSKCLTDKEWKQAIGLSLDSRRLDVLEKTIKSASEDGGADLEDLLGYVLEGVMESEGEKGKGEGEWREGVSL